jgi:hypothetical protein
LGDVFLQAEAALVPAVVSLWAMAPAPVREAPALVRAVLQFRYCTHEAHSVSLARSLAPAQLLTLLRRGCVTAMRCAAVAELNRALQANPTALRPLLRASDVQALSIATTDCEADCAALAAELQCLPQAQTQAMDVSSATLLVTEKMDVADEQAITTAASKSRPRTTSTTAAMPCAALLLKERGPDAALQKLALGCPALSLQDAQLLKQTLLQVLTDRSQTGSQTSSHSVGAQAASLVLLWTHACEVTGTPTSAAELVLEQVVVHGTPLHTRQRLLQEVHLLACLPTCLACFASLCFALLAPVALVPVAMLDPTRNAYHYHAHSLSLKTRTSIFLDQ